MALDLTKQIVRDGEGAQSLIEVRVDRARDAAQAKRVAKAIVNSPLVKTAVHGGDPNWGRVAMAIGKCSDDTDIDQEAVVIRFGADEVYPRRLDDADLAALSTYMKGTDVLIHVSLATGDADATVWGCDLSDDYVRFNADYTTSGALRRLAHDRPSCHPVGSDSVRGQGAQRAGRCLRASRGRCATHVESGLQTDGHFGGMRMPPSTRMVSAFM